MAKGIFESLLNELNIADVAADSAGTAAFTGLPASDHAVAAAAELGADIRGHRSKRISQYLLDEADVVFCMTGEHAKIVSDFVPAQKVFVLRGGVPDPYGGDLEEYRKCAAELLRKLRPLAEQMGGSS